MQGLADQGGFGVIFGLPLVGVGLGVDDSFDFHDFFFGACDPVWSFVIDLSVSVHVDGGFGFGAKDVLPVEGGDAVRVGLGGDPAMFVVGGDCFCSVGTFCFVGTVQGVKVGFGPFVRVLAVSVQANLGFGADVLAFVFFDGVGITDAVDLRPGDGKESAITRSQFDAVAAVRVFSDGFAWV